MYICNKINFPFLASVVEENFNWERSFSNRCTKSAVFAQKADFLIKSQLLKEIRNFQKLKNISSWSQILGVIFTFSSNSIKKMYIQPLKIGA